MAESRDILIRKRLDEAEGYLLLDLPNRALELLNGRTDWGRMQFEALLFRGEAQSALKNYREALVSLERAGRLRPTDPRLAFNLGWCYKRTNRLAQAIDSLTRAVREHPGEPLLHYNLACYWSLAGNAAHAIRELAIALELGPELRKLIAGESDFEAIRGNPEFERVTKIHASSP
jgi:tetratricopeptide (TPR) repeat protein